MACIVLLIITYEQDLLIESELVLQETQVEPSIECIVLQLVAEQDTQVISPGMFIVQEPTCLQMRV